MKLGKKNAARQKAIRKALASGRALGGLLIGLATALSGGCRERNAPKIPMGESPRAPEPREESRKQNPPADDPPEPQADNEANEFDSDDPIGYIVFDDE